VHVRGATIGNDLLSQLEELRRRQFDGSASATQPVASPFAQPPQADVATISDDARQALEDEERERRERERAAPGDDAELSDGEQQMLRELEARDREVRAHEQAHKAAAGDLAVGGPSYVYQTGPDGKRYAIGGEVKVRLRSGRTPEETLRNMERALRAANAPESPSGPDRAVAAKATELARQAREQLDEQRREDDGLQPGALVDRTA